MKRNKRTQSKTKKQIDSKEAVAPAIHGAKLPKLKKALIVPDLHSIFVDPAAFDVACQIGEDNAVDTVVQLGDLADFYPVSKYEKSPERATGAFLNEEMRFARGLINRMASIGDDLTILEGNHEQRLSKYLAREAPGLMGLTGLSVEDMYGIDGEKIKYEKTFLNLGALIAHHGDKISRGVSSFSAFNAKRDVERAAKSFIVGHVHRLGSYNKRVYDSQIAGYEAGCLCSFDVDYATFCNWQQGGAIVDYEDQPHGKFYVQLFQIFGAENGDSERKTIFGDRFYSSKTGLAF